VRESLDFFLSPVKQQLFLVAFGFMDLALVDASVDIIGELVRQSKLQHSVINNLHNYSNTETPYGG
jgi:hypothetical protein